MSGVAARSLSIEVMAGRHVAPVRAIDELCYSSPWSAATWRHEIVNPDRHHLVLRLDGKIVGHAGSMRVLDELHIITVAVHPDCRGGGLATGLVLELLDEGIGSGALTATLDVRASAHRTQRLYGRLGFRPAGVRSRYYTDPVDDAIIMWLYDLPSAEIAKRLDRVRAELGCPPGASIERGGTP